MDKRSRVNVHIVISIHFPCPIECERRGGAARGAGVRSGGGGGDE